MLCYNNAVMIQDSVLPAELSAASMRHRPVAAASGLRDRVGDPLDWPLGQRLGWAVLVIGVLWLLVAAPLGWLWG
jgi:hypothetical protein